MTAALPTYAMEKMNKEGWWFTKLRTLPLMKNFLVVKLAQMSLEVLK